MGNATEFLIRHRSFVGFLFLVAALWLATPNARSISIGFFIMMIGMFFRGWSSGYIDKDRELATQGPYSLTRNPLYFGNLLLAAGIAVAGNNWLTVLVCAAFYFPFFTFLIAVERRRMRSRFGSRYDEWARQANLFFPRIKRIDASNFNIAFYMKNREYRVFFYSLFVIAVLIVKYLRKIGFIGSSG
ncbi:MAG: isoprenylcysteine carboxylmethyltransferase family protein [Candidatus Aminicenantes bacterium]|nr:isoprenylcysteine carboxylmethyltransferase family protein [Candidatus Aminicenantes bacterium]